MLTVSGAFVAHVSEGAGTSRPSLFAFFAQLLDAEEYTGVKENEREKEKEKERKKKRGGEKEGNKQGLPPISNRVLQHVWDVTTHLSPSFSSPAQYYNFMVSSTSDDNDLAFQMAMIAFLKRRRVLCVNVKLDLSKWK